MTNNGKKEYGGGEVPFPVEQGGGSGEVGRSQ